MKTFITSMAVAMLLAVTANADVIHQNDYEAEPTTGFSLAPATMEFTDGGGDLEGFSDNGGNGFTGNALGVSSANANSGSFHYAVDTGATSATAGNGWGASWSGISSSSAQGSGGFSSQADALAAGAGCYIDFSEGATFTVSAMVATDAADPLIGSGTAAPRLEFHDAGGAELFRNSSSTVTAATISDTYQLISHTYTLTAADAALPIVRVTGVLGTDGNGHNPGVNDGMVYYDDFLFEVNSANVVLVGDGHTVPVPEPATATLLLGGLLGLCGVRRRKS